MPDAVFYDLGKLEMALAQRDALAKALDEAKKVISGVVTSYPVAAGTSKYGYEEDHDGYGSIRECRLYLERSGDPVGGRA